MESAEIRQRFLKFFEQRGHTVVPSASLLLDDPTLLFVNAGMVPFKPYFLGEAAPPYKTATSAQKVVRTLDIEEVGKTTRHASFFQMCGNFSFGDYFKEGAIPMAWELLTASVSDGGYGFPEEKLWVTVYEDDDEAEELWHKKVGVPRDRIQRRGQVDNFWSMGVPGPCGPCSEIYYDRGPEHGIDGGPVADEDRYLEVWNLVFMQFERGAGPGKENYPILGELPAKNIDTGMGLERMAALLQGVDNIYEIDTTRIILDKASALSGVKYGANEKTDVALRVVADHARTCAFLIVDGVVPGNEGRGYVLRRILRRVVRNMRLLGTNEPVMSELIDATIISMAPQYPELQSEANRIRTIAVNEEAAFLSTLKSGTTIFDTAVKQLKAAAQTTVPGEQVFQLHDTYGFPFDLTLEMAREAGLEVDETGFRSLMQEQRERAKADARARKSGLAAGTAYKEVMEQAGASKFVGYERVSAEARVGGLLVDGNSVQSAGPGSHVEVILDTTAFYAEAGGQLGDHGTITLDNGATLEVFDVQTPVPGLFIHRATVLDGEVNVGAGAIGTVDLARRMAISRAHTATHMIHKSFRELLGDTATQMGSENSPGRLRFDFPLAGAVPDDVMAEVEARVNTLLLDDLPVTAEYMSQEAARKIGAMALFGEKYGDEVRVVSVGDWARELCGGTHTPSTGHLGVVKFLSEGSIGAGVRRVEALVGSDAYSFLAKEHILVNRLADLVKARPEEMVERIEGLISKLKDAEKEIDKYRSANLRSNLGDLVHTSEVSGVVVRSVVLPDGSSANDLRVIVTELRGQVSAGAAGVVIGMTTADAKVSTVVAVNEVGIGLGLSAGQLLSGIAPAIDGRGGGKPDMAQGGGTNVAGIPIALGLVESLILDAVKK
jgi:alanyl-tRNA synthetase